MKNTYNFSLSIKNIKDIPFEKYEQDFTFHLGGKNYKTSRFVADLLSPYVRQLHYSDNTIQEFYIENENYQEGESKNVSDQLTEHDQYFKEFLNLCKFENNEVDLKRREYYSEYFYLLGNIEEMIRIEGGVEGVTEGNIKGDEAVERLLRLKRHIKETANSEMIEKLILIVSKEFEQVSKEKMKYLGYDMIERIISNDELKLKDEDSLFEFITELYLNDRTYSPLFEYVSFNNISNQNLEEFIKIFDIEYLNQGTWKSICQRLISKSDKTSLKSSRYNNKYDVRRIEGIMKQLTNETGSNIHDNGTITITSDSIGSDSNHPKNLVDYQKENYYGSNYNKLGFVCFDFKEKSIKLTGYTIKSNSNSSGACSPKSWVVEVSNDNNEWEEIDRHENDSSLKGSKIMFTFKIQNQNEKENFYRFIRLRQMSKGWDRSDDRIWFYSIDFNGEIRYESKQ